LKTATAACSAPKSSPSGILLQLAVASLKPHPLNGVIYSKRSLEDLVESIRQHGVLEPLLVTGEDLVISGHRRLEGAQIAGLTAVPAIRASAASEAELVRLLLEANRQRLKSNEERLREFREYLRIEQASAKARQGTRTDLRADMVESLPPSCGGKARELAAAKVGWAGRTAEKGLKVLEAIESWEESENMQLVEEVRTLLNDRGIDGAYKRAIGLGWINTAGTPKTQADRSHAEAPKVRAPKEGDKGAAAPAEPLGETKLVAETRSESQPAPLNPLTDPAMGSDLPEQIATLVSPEASDTEEAEPAPAPSSEPWLVSSRVDGYVGERRQQNAAAPEQWVLAEEQLARVEQLTRTLVASVNETMDHMVAAEDALPVIEAIRKSLTWIGTELSVAARLRQEKAMSLKREGGQA
jgi:hypothetical protein